MIKHKIDKNTPIVVYCSIGYRSEKVGEKLLNEGFTVYNLYGGIFNWKNSNNPVVDNNEIATQKVHCFNQEWSKWLLKGEKIYD
jgi:predicted sulfurtransferase